MQDLWQRGTNLSSALMSFETHKHKYIWDKYIIDPKAAIKGLGGHGDQKWIQKWQLERTLWPTLFPNEIVSFKSECRSGLPKAAKIVCYHGKPSIIESLTQTTKAQNFVIPPTEWVREYWKDD